MSASIISLFLLGICVPILCNIGRRRKQNHPLPPTPTPSKIPLVGNALQLSTRQEWLQVTDWGKELGPVFMITAFGKNVVFLNTVDAARDLLVDRWKIYSERPRLVMVKDLMGLGFAFTLQNLTDPIYHTFRRIFVREFSRHAVGSYHDIIIRECHATLSKLRMEPANVEKHLHNQVLVTVMTIAYGHRTTKPDDEYVQSAEKALRAMSDVMRPGTLYLVELFPFLEHIPAWFPGAGFRRVAREGRKLVEQARFGGWASTFGQYAQGKLQISFFTRLMESHRDGKVSLDVVRDSCAVLHGAASDTTMSTLLTFLLAILYAPEAQERAQRELDDVTGGSRLPSFSDRAKLPYINAMVKEVLRWELVIPLGLPHVTLVDDVYKGMSIPAGTTVMPNQYGMSHDPDVYPEPMLFRPERFLGEHKQRDPSAVAFGFGARICPGRHLAEHIVWMNIASILTCFDIKRPLNSSGAEYLPPRSFTSGLTSRPEFVDCRLVPRADISIFMQDDTAHE